MARRKRANNSALDGSKKEPNRRKRPTTLRYSAYVFRVLKQVHPELSMTKKAMNVMNDFMHDIFRRLVEEAATLVKVTNKSTLSSAEFQTATRLILPGELSKHAVNDATKAVANFMRSRADDNSKYKLHLPISEYSRDSGIHEEHGDHSMNGRSIEIEILASDTEKSAAQPPAPEKVETSGGGIEEKSREKTNGTEPTGSLARSNEERNHDEHEETLPTSEVDDISSVATIEAEQPTNNPPTTEISLAMNNELVDPMLNMTRNPLHPKENDSLLNSQLSVSSQANLTSEVPDGMMTSVLGFGLLSCYPDSSYDARIVVNGSDPVSSTSAAVDNPLQGSKRSVPNLKSVDDSGLPEDSLMDFEDADEVSRRTVKCVALVTTTIVEKSPEEQLDKMFDE